jgi:hypothetical protein
MKRFWQLVVILCLYVARCALLVVHEVRRRAEQRAIARAEHEALSSYAEQLRAKGDEVPPALPVLIAALKRDARGA